MNSFLETYTMLIRTITPVHIGSGDRLSAAVDFVRQNGNLVVIDHERLLQWVAHQPDAERLADQLTQAFADPARGINEFLNSESVKLRLDIKAVQAYVLPYSGRPRESFAFIKNSANQPYLPGSSLKGALRSAILRGAMLVITELQDFASRQVQEGSKEQRTRSQHIEARLFAPGAQESRKIPNYDINRLLVVRDSHPLP
ncbi:MAG: type III-A CRISPR-associated RAMP protein Csm5, partial [Candidatus Methanomethylicaceae archaeon]